ncbi:hypothetical protein FA95DRAFT_709628 [Auriscalpium vulgare]|uniref:Uncharacterized protein n=2 Tax=Auriscalpium vulgare TaxID=40419 RepID=A0ACB8RBB1_9AGAM|nr:hypothetical protein FA95DRAFT_851999 [Auriscalpium vulgare]KAI0041338.1 hypothetical protein FA95DRAFT_709628 [Auriscalpium vulgare]
MAVDMRMETKHRRSARVGASRYINHDRLRQEIHILPVAIKSAAVEIQISAGLCVCSYPISGDRNALSAQGTSKIHRSTLVAATQYSPLPTLRGQQSLGATQHVCQPLPFRRVAVANPSDRNASARSWAHSRLLWYRSLQYTRCAARVLLG